MIAPVIEQICAEILRRYHPDRIILFGSHARGDARPDSDVDLLVISDRESEKTRTQRGLQLRSLGGQFKVPFDLLIYTHEEFEKFLPVAQSFTATVNREGVVLHG